MKELTYPRWTCEDCALKYGGRVPNNHLSCWHLGYCDACDEKKEVTQPRDFCFPKYPQRILEKVALRGEIRD